VAKKRAPQKGCHHHDNRDTAKRTLRILDETMRAVEGEDIRLWTFDCLSFGQRRKRMEDIV
jgi:hypothetical protein